MAETDSMQFGIIQIGPSLIAIPIEHLSEVLHVRKEEPIAQNGALLRGGIELRGRIVPILDVQALAGLPEPDAAAKLGVIIEHAQRLVVIFADKIVGIATIAAKDIHGISKGCDADTPLFKNIFAYDDGFASVLDVATTFASPDIFTAKRPDISKKDVLRTHEPVLTFEAGRALYSVPAVEVYAAIPRQRIERTAITMGACLGEITYHGRRIPVVCPFTILGLGNRERPALTEIVALRFPDDLVLGFAVDAIHEIGTFSGVKETTIPIWQSGRNFIDRVVIRNDDEQIFAINLENLRAATDLLTIAKLSQDDQPSETPPQTQISSEQNITREKERYLVVDACDRLAIPLSQVNRIVEPPTRTTPADAGTPGFSGYFSRFNESIALFDLGACRGRQAVNDTRAKILLTGRPGHQIGFLVDHVVSIEMSEWCEKPGAAKKRGETTLVQLGDGPAAKVLPAFNLLEALDDHAAKSVCG